MRGSALSSPMGVPLDSLFGYKKKGDKQGQGESLRDVLTVFLYSFVYLPVCVAYWNKTKGENRGQFIALGCERMRGSALSSPMGVPLDLYSNKKERGQPRTRGSVRTLFSRLPLTLWVSPLIFYADKLLYPETLRHRPPALRRDPESMLISKRKEAVFRPAPVPVWY